MTEREIFLAALDIPNPAARARYLDGVCRDPKQRARVEALLVSHNTAGSFLGSPAVQPPGSNSRATRAMGGVETPDHENAADGALAFLTAPTRPDSLGRLGHYEMFQVLGKGGFGVVFRAFDDVLQRVVAVKVLASQMAILSPARKRFLREARSAAAVRHENVVQIYEVGEQPLPYLVMEFIPGETLQQRLDRTGPLDVSEVLRIGRQIAEGLAAAHASDLIHRDIKPANILLEGGSPKAKLTDFGLARAADDASISQSGFVAGTPLFMAPEQALGHPIDRRADLFSLGSVLYQMVSGRPPFRAPSALAVLKRVAEEPPRPIPEIIPETPDWLCRIIAKLHAKDPADRFQSAQEVADLLAACEATLRAKQDVSNVLPPAVKPARRKWLAAAAVLLLAVVALAVTEAAGVTDLFRARPATPADAKVARAGDKEPAPRKVPGAKKAAPPARKPTVAVAPPAPTVHDTWIKAVALLPLDQHAAALPARLKRRLPGFDDAFLRALPALAADRQAVMADAWLKERQPAFAGREDVWLGAIPALAAETQVVLVAAWLRERNSGFDGAVTHRIERGVVTSLEVPSPLVHDLRPLRALTGLRALRCRNPVGYDNQAPRDAALLRALKSLETVNGKPVAQFWKEVEARSAEFREWLQLVATLNAGQKVAVVAAKLKERNPGFDGRVAPKIEGGEVTGLTFKGVRDLSPLRALRGLKALDCAREVQGGALSDLSPLQGLPLTTLILTNNVRVGDLSPLRGMRLTNLDLNGCQKVRDLGPLRGMPLTNLNLRGTKVPNLESLAGMPLTSLSLSYCPQVRDLAPLKGMKLTLLDLYQCQVEDLEPLKGMPLNYLFLAECTRVRDLSPLRGMPVTTLVLDKCPEVRDLSPLRGMPLVSVSAFLCPQVTDLGPLEGMRLKRLDLHGSGVTDLKPLQAMPLEDLRLTPGKITQGLDGLRGVKSLKTIGVSNTRAWPAAEFWDRHDKGEFKR